jgi:hypothetical protein
MKLPRLSLRELFLLVALAAMGCGWWVDRRRAAHENGALRREIIELLARVRNASGDL